MPLDAECEACSIGDADGLDCLVFGDPFDDNAFARFKDCLTVQRVDPEARRADDGLEPATGHHADLVRRGELLVGGRRLRRAVNAYVRDGFLPVSVLDRATRRETDDRLPAIVAGIKGADPDITLQAICTRLEAMRERTPRGRTIWQPSSVKMLLERARKLGLLS